MLPTIYNSSISDYLVIHGFERKDQGISVDFMEWHKEDTIIRFEGTTLTIFKEKATYYRKPVYNMQGFIPSDYILFVFLMHSWNIISIKTTVKKLRDAGLVELKLESIFEMVKDASNGSGN